MAQIGVRTMLPVALAAVLLLGVLLITLGTTALTTVGVLLVIVGLMGLMPVVHLGLTSETSDVTPPR